MSKSDLNFESFAQDAHKYLNELSQELEHPDEKNRVLRIWRAVMHTVRDRIHHGESHKIIDPLPMIFKGIFVEQWTFNEKPTLHYETLEEMKTEVKNLQRKFGEEDFPWKKSTEEIIHITLNSLKSFMSESHLEQIIDHMPGEIKSYLKEKI